MADEPKEIVFQPGQEFIADPKKKAVELNAALEELGLVAPHQPAEELVGTTFQIRSCKAVDSEEQEGRHYYFCECVDPESGERFTTSLGGQVVVEKIDAYIASGKVEPLEITLGFAKGRGVGEGYYYVA